MILSFWVGQVRLIINENIWRLSPSCPFHFQVWIWWEKVEHFWIMQKSWFIINTRFQKRLSAFKCKYEVTNPLCFNVIMWWGERMYCMLYCHIVENCYATVCMFEDHKDLMMERYSGIYRPFHSISHNV